jgi:NADPH:quinone reductase-like Zn-dependent oxidoreductase
MRQIQFRRTGLPAEVVECVEVADPTISAPDEVLVAIEVFPINPADLLTMQGYYPRSNPDAATLGLEAFGVVEAVGVSVTDIVPGGGVILLSVDNWSEKKVVKAREVVRVSPTLRELGADAVLMDGDDLAARVIEATNGAAIRLAADAVAGGRRTGLRLALPRTARSLSMER